MSAMAQPTIDLDDLLRPISSASPAGDSLRYESTYDFIKEARREEPQLSQGVWQREQKRADWGKVEELCLSALKGRSKDLQIAIWLTEAWLHLDGISGAAFGLKLIERLHEEFWATMYPAADDLEYRTTQIEWLNEKFPVQFSFIPISAPVDGAVVPAITFADWEAAQYNEQNAHRLKQDPSANRLQVAQCQQSMNCTPADFYRALWTQLRDCATACKDLDETLEKLYGSQNPGLTKLLTILESIASVTAPYVHEAMEPSMSDEPPFEEESSDSAANPALEVFVPRNTIQSRSDAYRCLAEAAEYLSRTEPHSPVPYLIRRAIVWGSMELDQLLPELLSNEGALRDVSNLLQIQPQKK